MAHIKTAKEIDLTPPREILHSEIERYLIENFSRLQQLLDWFTRLSDDSVQVNRAIYAHNVPIVLENNTLAFKHPELAQDLFLKLGPSTQDPLGGEIFPVIATRLDVVQHIQSATDPASYDLSDEAIHELIGCRITADINYASGATIEFFAVLSDISGRGATVTSQFLLNSVSIGNPLVYDLVGSYIVAVTVTLTAFPAINDVISVQLSAVKNHPNSLPIVEPDAQLRIIQPGVA